LHNARPVAPMTDQPTPPGLARRSLFDLPGPPGLPLIGNALELDPRRLHDLMIGWARQYGPLFVFRVAFQPVVVVSDVEAIHQILRDRPDRFRRWRKIEQIASDIRAEGVFSAEGVAWRHQRKLVMHALNANQIREFVPRLEQVTGRLRRRWWRAALSGAVFDMHADLKRFTVDVTSGLAFGKDLNTLEGTLDPLQRHLHTLFSALARRQTALIPYWRYFQLPVDRETAVAVREVGKVIDGLIADTRVRLRAQPGLRARPSNLVEALVAAHEEDETDLSDAEIGGNMMTLLLAGEDTTANTISWIAHFLMEYPEVQARVREEVDHVFGLEERPWRDPSETCARLRYVEAVAHEAMRCKPVGGEIFLEPYEDVDILGVHVPKGTPVLALTSMLGAQADNFDCPEAFRPERWLDDAGASGVHNARAFAPFGGGPRFCPGRQLAMLEIYMVVAMLCRDFEILRPVDAPPPESEYAITVGPTHVHALLRPRRSLRFGLDIDLRVGERRVREARIQFPDRRLAERRQRVAAH